MNISTYEARIAALEAQLGPGPGPVPETGLISFVVTPDITLSDGNSLNSILATHMPLTSGEKRVESFVQEFPTLAYTVTITPGSSWKAQFIGESDSGSVGEAISKVYHVSEDGILTFGAFASSDPLDDDAPFGELKVKITRRA